MTTSIKTKTTLAAFRHEFEIVCIMSIVALAADCVWLVHDIIANGMSITYGVVGALLTAGLSGILYVLYRHNIQLCKELLHNAMMAKVKLLKIKRKHK